MAEKITVSLDRQHSPANLSAVDSTGIDAAASFFPGFRPLDIDVGGVRFHTSYGEQE
ncbi:hypothetical protein [Reyranella massiliensis]|uniref:hypothetical protein n=1 Tax=Reyranella massiliensis TaxID=445220 RepID=UPI001C06DFBD|nr:hypothetical protein [Reyranella massiliensis]